MIVQPYLLIYPDDSKQSHLLPSLPLASKRNSSSFTLFIIRYLVTMRKLTNIHPQHHKTNNYRNKTLQDLHSKNRIMGKTCFPPTINYASCSTRTFEFSSLERLNQSMKSNLTILWVVIRNRMWIIRTGPCHSYYGQQYPSKTQLLQSLKPDGNENSSSDHVYCDLRGLRATSIRLLFLYIYKICCF